MGRRVGEHDIAAVHSDLRLVVAGADDRSGVGDVIKGAAANATVELDYKNAGRMRRIKADGIRSGARERDLILLSYRIRGTDGGGRLHIGVQTRPVGRDLGNSSDRVRVAVIDIKLKRDRAVRCVQCRRGGDRAMINVHAD